MIEDNRQLPRVLILNQPFNRETGGGITLTNLFSAWRREDLAVACTGELKLVDTSVCNTYYRLGEQEHRWLFPFNLFQRKYTSGPIVFDENKDKEVQDLSIAKSSLRTKIILQLVFPLLELFGLIHLLEKTSLSPQFCQWLDDLDPDVIYAQGSSRASILFCTAVQSYLQKPMVFHMMDDWPETISEKGPFHSYWKKKIDRELRILLDHTSLLLTICDEMSRAYERRYHKESVAFHNPIDMAFWKAHQRGDYALAENPVLLYAGRIGLGIDDSLKKLAQAVQIINSELEMSLRLVIQTDHDPRWAVDFDCVEHKRFVPYKELPRVFAEADLLVLPYDFSPGAVKYIRYSMPTKASEYMVSGTPILLFAPAETAVVKYARSSHWAKVVDKNEIEPLVHAMKALILSEEERRSIAGRAKRIADRQHSMEVVSKHFAEVLASVISEDISAWP
jgi:glycosyltransferase involved in cell wall biosynthesis